MSASRKCFPGSARVWLALLAVAVGTLATAAPALALPANFWGVVPQAPPTAEEYARLKQGGVDSIRIGLLWDTIQPQRGGAFEWGPTDAEVEDATKARIEVLPFSYGAPSWAVPSARVPGSTAKAPRQLPVAGQAKAAWAALLKAAVARYGPGGEFWSAHPDLPERPLRTWQIWNEENFKYFVARPNPIEYGKLVKSSYAAIKAVDRGARVILGGMFAWPKEARWNVRPPQAYYAADFLERMYRSTPGLRSKFNGVALHPYSANYKRLNPQIEELRKVLKKNHDAGKGLWITELGWSSQQPSQGNQFAKGLQGQATQLKGAFSLLRQKQAKWRVKQVFWFSVDDRQSSCNFCDGSGLFSEGLVPKPAWYAYVRFAGGVSG